MAKAAAALVAIWGRLRKWFGRRPSPAPPPIDRAPVVSESSRGFVHPSYRPEKPWNWFRKKPWWEEPALEPWPKNVYEREVLDPLVRGWVQRMCAATGMSAVQLYEQLMRYPLCRQAAYEGVPGRVRRRSA